MGHPISSSGPTEQHLPMALQPRGAIARASQHRQSRSISSLPVEKLSKINCEKRTSVSALNSPAASPAAAKVLGETDKGMKQTSIGSILGQDCSARRKGARARRGGDAPNLSGVESGSESDRKPSRLNLFRGHRRVGSGSNITNKTPPAWDSSPRAKLHATSTRSATASPTKKLDKYAVAKIAASLFHSPGAKLERSQSQRASSPRRVEKKRDNHALTAGELIVPVNHSDGSSIPTEECGVEGGPRSSSCSVQHMEETSIPPASKASSVQTHVIDDTDTEEAPPPPPPLASTPVEDPSPCITEHMIPSESAPLNSPVLETAEPEILLEKFYQTSPDDVSAQPCGMPDTNMEVVPDSPTVSIAALFEDTVVEEEEETRGVDDEGSTGAGGNALLLQVESEHSDRGDLRLCESGDFEDGSSFPTAHLCHVAMKETREEDGAREDLPAEEYAIGDCQSTQALSLFPIEKLPTEEEELTEASAQCTISTIDGEVPIRAPSPAQEQPSSSPPPPPPPFLSEDHSSPGRRDLMKFPSPLEEPERFPCRDLPMLRVSSSPRLMGLLLQPPPPEEPASCCKQVKVHHVVKPTLRKRRRSASGSGLSAMLLKVVRVPEEGTIVTRRFVESPEWGQMESPSGVEGFGREGGSGVCESEPEDAVKSTYSKFVDIEIDPGHGCVELVQHSKDIYHDNTADIIGWKRHPQAAFFERQFRNSPRRLPPVKINTCSVYEGKARARKSKTIRRGRMNSGYDLDTLKEYLKTTNSISALAKTDPITETPKAKAEAGAGAGASPPAVPPPPPPPPPAKLDSFLSTRERSRTFVSRLQAPSSGAFSYVDVDVYRPCSVSILSNPSFSSSHQDKLWEEQAEIYSSGGRGTPGRDDDDDDDDDKARAGDKAAAAAQPTPPPQTLLYNLHHSPLPGFGSIHHQQQHEQNPPGFHPTLRRSALGSGSLRSPSESGHFMHQIMSKIRGSSPKRVSPSAATIARAPGSCPTSQLEIAKRRNPWSSCICFSVKS